MRPTDSPFKRALLFPLSSVSLSLVSSVPFVSLFLFTTLYNQKRRHRSSDIIHPTKEGGEEEEKYENEWMAGREDELTVLAHPT